MKEDVLSKKISDLSAQICKKESELDELKRERDRLEDSLKYNNITFRIKCSNSSFRLSMNMDPDDLYIDVRSLSNNGQIVARSAKEIRSYIEDIFDDYVVNKAEYTICTCSDVTLNTIGTLIAEYRIVPNNIEVIAYTESCPDGCVCHFTRDGYLTNWEIGMLS